MGIYGVDLIYGIFLFESFAFDLGVLLLFVWFLGSLSNNSKTSAVKKSQKSR
jgi:hypothetical protein